MGYFKDPNQGLSINFNPMDHIDAGIDGDTEPDHRVVKFEVDLEPGQVGGLPRIYPRPHELHRRSAVDHIAPLYALVIDREAIVGALDPDMLAQVRTGKLPLGGDEPMTTVTLSAMHPPEVKTLLTVGSERYIDYNILAMDRLVKELQCLDARNVVRDYLFYERRLRLGVEAYHFEVGGYERPGVRDHHHSVGGTPRLASKIGVKLKLIWIAVEL